ncbi:tetratricopeptide repeat protein [Rhizobium sp. SL86]|uniref:tetratricopeptide repeat protein n=1 Tax=Rhizobium sp. SL86 TaxID=2995148 RepID=UPI0022728036|nr:tetratricopeptide repeat protein [Rhizobium sp. SL86]MCY1669398.1 tetratricopeptide repeat protein [Rhizobium sp. SL86]
MDIPIIVPSKVGGMTMALFARFYPSSTLLRKADTARDARDWERAAYFYRRFLNYKANAAGIWIQYGHALKESGQYGAANAAYSKAVALEPGNSDAHLQLGHLLKIMGRMELAQESYERSHSIDHNEDADRELAALKNDALAKQARHAMDQSALEDRLASFGKQIEYILSHVSTVKALSFEITGIKKMLPIAAAASPYDMFIATSESLLGQLAELTSTNRTTPQLMRDIEDLRRRLQSFEIRNADEV